MATTVQQQFTVLFPENPATVQDIITGLTGIIPASLQGKDRYNNDTLLLGGGKVRVSTAVCFVDTENNVLVWGRPAEMQENQNNALDCFGAVAFNNISLQNKLPSNFLNASIIDYILCPGFAIEVSDAEDAIMAVWVVIVDDVSQGVIPEKSFVRNADELRSRQERKTAKLELALANLWFESITNQKPPLGCFYIFSVFY